MEVYVVWRTNHAPLEVFTTQRRALALVLTLKREGFEAFVTSYHLNGATPDPQIRSGRCPP